MKPYIHLKVEDSIYDITRSVFSEIVKAIDLYDMCQYFISLDTDKWVPNCYWTTQKSILKKRSGQEILWGVYSYLIHNEFILIEKKVGTDSLRITTKRDSYYNKLENLYRMVIKRLLNEKYLIQNDTKLDGYYRIGNSYQRQKNLDELLN